MTLASANMLLIRIGAAAIDTSPVSVFLFSGLELIQIVLLLTLHNRQAKRFGCAKGQRIWHSSGFETSPLPAFVRGNNQKAQNRILSSSTKLTRQFDFSFIAFSTHSDPDP